MSARRFRRNRHDRVRREAARVDRLKALAPASVAAGGGVTAAVLFAPAADAATFNVTNLGNDGHGSLREAVEAANQADGDDTITFQSGLSGTIELSGADSDIELYGDGGLNIQGPGADQITIDGNGTDRILFLTGFDSAGEAVSISGLTLTGGSANVGGALYSTTFTGRPAAVTIEASVLTDNQASSDGGAIYGNGSAWTIVDSVISENTAGGFGGAAYLYGADLDNTQGTGIAIRSTSIINNVAAGDGGAVQAAGSNSDIVVDASTISGNSAGDEGGGIVLYGQKDGVTTMIASSTIAANSAEGSDAGGIALMGTSGSAPGPTVIENSTISGNSAVGRGGGIYTYNNADNERTIRNSTVVDNTAGSGGGVYEFASDNGGVGSTSDDVTVSSTIFADNSPTDLANNASVPPQGSFVTGFSLIEDSGDAELTESPAGSNIIGENPDLGPLASNGGPTQTHLPSISSPVLDAGIANGLATEQRGLARTSELQLVPNQAGSDATDIGSVEIQAADFEAACQGAVVRRLAGSDASDEITGTEGPESIFGLPGDDSLSALGANDCVAGDAGNDTADGGAGNDLVDGGEGNDNLIGSGGKDKLTGEAGRDRLNGGPAKDKLTGAGGKDKLKGAAGKDKVSGGGGKDKINPGKGKDKVKAGGGKDKIKTADGKKDKVNCGGGKDKATVDAKDKVKANCDVVKVKGG